MPRTLPDLNIPTDRYTLGFFDRILIVVAQHDVWNIREVAVVAYLVDLVFRHLTVPASSGRADRAPSLI
jgi:hypothetical protein